MMAPKSQNSPVLAKIANPKGIPEQIFSDSLLQLRRQRGRLIIQGFYTSPSRIHFQNIGYGLL
jgi:hypothetical protein